MQQSPTATLADDALPFLKHAVRKSVNKAAHRFGAIKERTAAPQA
jgi:hypothetical protein